MSFATINRRVKSCTHHECFWWRLFCEGNPSDYRNGVAMNISPIVTASKSKHRDFGQQGSLAWLAVRAT
jgi:hypothetical protein